MSGRLCLILASAGLAVVPGCSATSVTREADTRWYLYAVSDSPSQPGEDPGQMVCWTFLNADRSWTGRFAEVFPAGDARVRPGDGAWWVKRGAEIALYCPLYPDQFPIFLQQLSSRQLVWETEIDGRPKWLRFGPDPRTAPTDGG